MSSAIIINLDLNYMAASGKQTLIEIVRSRKGWPSGAKCASQEADGEILYWSEEPDAVKIAKEFAGAESLMPHIGFKHQIDSWFSDDESPLLARDWLTSVVTYSEWFSKEST